MANSPWHGEGCGQRHTAGTLEQHRPDRLDDPAVKAWAIRLLGEVGLAITRPRVWVLTALRGRARPVGAQDLHLELLALARQNGTADQAPGLTTVYRALSGLAQRGVLHCFHRDDGTTTYRLCQPSRHDHLVCRCCGLIQEHPSRSLAAWTEQPFEFGGFAIEDYHAQLIGLCPACRPTPTG